MTNKKEFFAEMEAVKTFANINGNHVGQWKVGELNQFSQLELANASGEIISLSPSRARLLIKADDAGNYPEVVVIGKSIDTDEPVLTSYPLWDAHKDTIFADGADSKTIGENIKSFKALEGNVPPRNAKTVWKHTVS